MAYKKATRLVKFLRRRSLVWPADVPDLDVGILRHMISLIDAF